MKKVHFGRTMHCLPQWLKSKFFDIFSSLAQGDPPLEKISKKRWYFSPWGKQCIVLPKWTFFHVLAHCAHCDDECFCAVKKLVCEFSETWKQRLQNCKYYLENCVVGTYLHTKQIPETESCVPVYFLRFGKLKHKSYLARMH